jgi:outer membrane receptor protein involved in Fe transport
MELVTSFSALNVFDTEYESSVGYPEPGRNFKISITLNQKRKH